MKARQHTYLANVDTGTAMAKQPFVALRDMVRLALQNATRSMELAANEAGGKQKSKAEW